MNKPATVVITDHEVVMKWLKIDFVLLWSFLSEVVYSPILCKGKSHFKHSN